MPMPDQKDLKVCFLAGTLGRGGAERQLIYMLRALQNAGVSTRVLCLTRGEALEEEIRAMGIEVKWVGASRWRPIRLCRIIQELRRRPADIVQSAHFYTNIYAAVAGRLLGISSIGAVRSDLSSELECNGMLGWGQLHLPKLLICNSKLARQRALAKGIQSDHIHLIPNVADVPELRKQSDGNGEDGVRILFAARLTQEKRLDRFLGAVRKIADSRPDLNFKAMIAGDGPLRARLEDLADSLDLRGRYVEFLGELADLKSTYEKSDLLVLASDWEGTPNVLLEAMGFALPVVATNVGGVPELVRNGENGFIVETNDAESMANSIVALIENPELRKSMGASGRRIVLENYSPSSLAEKLLGVYQGMSRGPARVKKAVWSASEPCERRTNPGPGEPATNPEVELI